MTGLASADRARLSKLLGLLGSDHAGERDAAGLAAHRLQQRSGLSWQQILKPPPIEKPLPQLGTWRSTVAECLDRRGSLRAWEIEFLTDLPAFRRLSTKQRYILNEIAGRVLRSSPVEPTRGVEAWRAMVAECLARADALTPWEANFLRNLRDFPRLSEKQLTILRGIADRLGLLAEAA